MQITSRQINKRTRRTSTVTSRSHQDKSTNEHVSRRLWLPRFLGTHLPVCQSWSYAGTAPPYPRDISAEVIATTKQHLTKIKISGWPSIGVNFIDVCHYKYKAAVNLSIKTYTYIYSNLTTSMYSKLKHNIWKTPSSLFGWSYLWPDYISLILRSSKLVVARHVSRSCTTN